MKHCLAIIVVIIFLQEVCNAQENNEYKLNAFSFELGKTGLIYNLSYDHRLAKNNFGFRVVAGSNFAKYLTAGVLGGGAYYLVGKSKHFFETGIDLQYIVVDETSDDQVGFAFVYPDHSINAFYPSLNIGYRRYGKKTLFRIGFSPGVLEGEFVPGGYISFGFVF